METLSQSLSKIESLEQSAQIADAQTNDFMQPPLPKEKGKAGRRPDTPEQKAQKAALKAQQQKQNAAGVKSSGPTDPIHSGPANNPQTNQNPGPSNKDIAKHFMPAVSTAMATWVGDPRAAMTPGEIDGCAEGLGMLMDKYMPTLMNQYGPEAAFLISFGAYGLRCYSMKRQIELEKFKQSQFQANQPTREKDEYVQTRPAEIVN